MLTTLLRTPSNLMRRGACERKNVVTPLALGIHHQGKPRMYHNQQDLASFLAERTNSSSSCSSLTFAQAQAGGSAHLGGASVSDNMGDVNEACSSSMKVYVMLPLDTVNADGMFRYAVCPWFTQALQLLVASGVYGVAVDIWWGAVEREPGQYSWQGYRQLFELVRSVGLKMQVVFSFHACGGNVGDTAQIPLPRWVLECGESDPDLFFTDRPRGHGRLGQRNREYVSIWADELPGVLCGRSPIECYTDFMGAFKAAFYVELGSLIEEAVVGCGPCGELRLPSYVEANGWRFPGVGEFQCYDRHALASLAAAAVRIGHPEWGYAGPHDAGHYTSTPETTGFFAAGGSWDTPYGRFFLDWYAGSLLKHGDRLLSAAAHIFAWHPGQDSQAAPGHQNMGVNYGLGKVTSGVTGLLGQRFSTAHAAMQYRSSYAGGLWSTSGAAPPMHMLSAAAHAGGIGAAAAASCSMQWNSSNEVTVRGVMPDAPSSLTRQQSGSHKSSNLHGLPCSRSNSIPTASGLMQESVSSGVTARLPGPQGNLIHGGSEACQQAVASLVSGLPEQLCHATLSHFCRSNSQQAQHELGQEQDQGQGLGNAARLQGPHGLEHASEISIGADSVATTATGASALSVTTASSSPLLASPGTGALSLSLSAAASVSGSGCGGSGCGSADLPGADASSSGSGERLSGAEVLRTSCAGNGRLLERIRPRSPMVKCQKVLSHLVNGLTGGSVSARGGRNTLQHPVASRAAVDCIGQDNNALASAAAAAATSHRRQAAVLSAYRDVAAALILEDGEEGTLSGSALSSENVTEAMHVLHGIHGVDDSSGMLDMLPGRNRRVASGSVITAGSVTVAGSLQSVHSLGPLQRSSNPGFSFSGWSGAQPRGSGCGTSSSGGGFRLSSGLLLGTGSGCNGIENDAAQARSSAASSSASMSGSQPCVSDSRASLAPVVPEPPVNKLSCAALGSLGAGPLRLGEFGGSVLYGVGEEPSVPMPSTPQPRLSNTAGMLLSDTLDPASMISDATHAAEAMAAALSRSARGSSCPELLRAAAASAAAACATMGSGCAAGSHHVSGEGAGGGGTHTHDTPAQAAERCAAASAAFPAYGGGGGPVTLTLKLAGIHWWYRSRSHAAELTAGYYNAGGVDGYAGLVELCARHRFALILTCVEMCDAQHPPNAQCGPEGLLRQVRLLAARAGVPMGGENALPIFQPDGVNATALDRIVSNTRALPGGSAQAAHSKSGSGLGMHGSSGALHGSSGRLFGQGSGIPVRGSQSSMVSCTSAGGAIVGASSSWADCSSVTAGHGYGHGYHGHTTHSYSGAAGTGGMLGNGSSSLGGLAGCSSNLVSMSRTASESLGEQGLGTLQPMLTNPSGIASLAGSRLPGALTGSGPSWVMQASQQSVFASYCQPGMVPSPSQDRISYAGPMHIPSMQAQWEDGSIWAQQQQQQDADASAAAAALNAMCLTSSGSNGSASLSFHMQQQQQQQQLQQQQQQLTPGAGPGHWQQQQQMAAIAGWAEAASSNDLPGLRSFTFLRLGPEMLHLQYRSLWMRFMQNMTRRSGLAAVH